MISRASIQQVVTLLAGEAGVKQIILFGSHARGSAREDSDLDLLVVEDHVVSRRGEMVRLRAVLRPLRIPVDVLVTDTQQFEAWKDQPGTALYDAAREGRVLYERAG